MLAALGGGRTTVGEKRQHGVVVEVIVPQRVLGAAAEQRRMRPARIGVHEGRVARETRIGIVAAQDRPFGELAGDRILDGVFGGVGIGELLRPCGSLRSSVSPPSMSSCEVAVVGATANGPDTGRASGLNKARLSNRPPRKPTLACAKADRPAGPCGRFCGSGRLRATGSGGFLGSMDDRPRLWQGNFLAAAMAVWALNAPATISARAKPWRFQLIAPIQSLARSS